MKTYAPKTLWGGDLPALLAQLHATPLDISKFLKVSERSVWRWLAEESAPFPVLALLWHETPRGRESAGIDAGNALVLARGMAQVNGAALAAESAKLARLLAICETGAANDAFHAGPPGGGPGPGRALQRGLGRVLPSLANPSLKAGQL